MINRSEKIVQTGTGFGQEGEKRALSGGREGSSSRAQIRLRGKHVAKNTNNFQNLDLFQTIDLYNYDS